MIAPMTAPPAATPESSMPPGGYSSAVYVATLGHIGTPLALPGSGGYLLRREIPNTSSWDAAGPYPLLSCTNWDALADDFTHLNEELVSVAAVIDPLASASREQLLSAFPDLLIPFKRHYVVDLSGDFVGARSKNHKRKVRRALTQVEVQRAGNPADFGCEWGTLYEGLIQGVGASGSLADFSAEGLSQQLVLAGTSYFRAMQGEECVGACLFIKDGSRAYYHLGASNAGGRKVQASYALFDAALLHAAEIGCELACLGGAASLVDDEQNGLARFKKGWSTDSVVAHLGGRILNPERYQSLTGQRPETDFFPAYRAPQSAPRESS
jgi:hypothetical protein